MTVHGRRELPGYVVQPPGWLLPDDQASGHTVEMKYLFVDTGLRPAEVADLVRIGDLVSFAQTPIELTSDWVAGHSLDNRASVAAVTACLEELQRIRHSWDVWAVASVQEEEVLGGAFTSPFEIRPDLAVAIDVTFGRGPGRLVWLRHLPARQRLQPSVGDPIFTRRCMTLSRIWPISWICPGMTI